MAYTVNQSIIDKAKADWEAANARGDKAGMEAAHAAAEAERAKAGYSGGDDGSQHNILPSNPVKEDPQPQNPTGWNNSWGTYQAGVNDFTTQMDKAKTSTDKAAVETARNNYIDSTGSKYEKTYNYTQPVSTDYVWNKTLSYGSKGTDVKALQNHLISLGYDVGINGADGSFGPDTLKAVKAYQKDNGLDVDGSVGPATGKSLMGSTAKQEEKPKETGNKNITIWKAVKDPSGNITFEQRTGTVSKDGLYQYDDLTGLENGDAILSADGTYKYYDADTMGFVDADTWNNKYAERKKPSDMSTEELYQYIKDALADSNIDDPNDIERFKDSDDVQNFIKSMTLPEAEAIANEKYNPIYNQRLQNTLDDIDKAAIPSGFYGQLPTEALKQQAVQSAETERTSAIMDLALSLVKDDRETALANLDAYIKEKEFNLGNLMQLVNLAQAYGSTDEEDGQPRIISNPNSGFIGGVTIPVSESQKPVEPVGSDTAVGSGYNNGGLSGDQIKELQGVLGVDQDGMYGPKTKNAASGVDAVTAYNELVRDQNFQNALSYIGRQYVAGNSEAGNNNIENIWDDLTDLQQKTLYSYLKGKGYIIN